MKSNDLVEIIVLNKMDFASYCVFAHINLISREIHQIYQNDCQFINWVQSNLNRENVRLCVCPSVRMSDRVF